MKLRTIVKIAITSSVVLLCSGFALYSFFRLSAAEDQKTLIFMNWCHPQLQQYSLLMTCSNL